MADSINGYTEENSTAPAGELNVSIPITAGGFGVPSDAGSSKPGEEELNYSFDYDVEYLDEERVFDTLELSGSSVDPLTEAGPSKPPKRQKKNKFGNQSLSTEFDELPSTSKNDEYRFEATVFEKKFKNQKSFERCGDVLVSGNSAEAVLEKIWQYCSKFIDRGVVFPDASENTGELKWDNPPTYEDRDKFMLFLDKVSKRSTPPSKVDGHTLQNWQTKDVTVMLYKYSDAVSTLHKWNQVESQLLRSQTTDRAGAESISSLNQVKEDLKKRHGRYLSADDVSWGCWANWICSKPMNMRDELTQQTPPQHVVGLFSTVPVHSDVLLEKAKLDFQVASTVNKAYVKVLQDLNDDHRQLLNIASVMGQRITMLQEKQTEFENMLTAMNSSVSVRENRFSVELAQSVTDCIDVDHL
ncbi:uncharacterized protein LOC110679829 [Aedes aegypti]|uniref:Uncharacterized protein n=1 Tax=Aedes aegypti TaxID=7159 RepID=A0A6I8U2S7_AEDAE|nr:uncharacterized protein LOC110679827 [Aedes aegypti]XP_021711283.1 uncharacterized protein LOC110679829 [Aedes aegypti]